jgi:hypothetical protein
MRIQRSIYIWTLIYGLSFIVFAITLSLIYFETLPFCNLIAYCFEAVGGGLILFSYILMPRRKLWLVTLVAISLLLLVLSLSLLKLLIVAGGLG